MSADDRFRGLSRRTFLGFIGKSAVFAMAAPAFTGCEQLLVRSKFDGGLAPFSVPPEPESTDGVLGPFDWFYQSGQRTSKDDAPDILPEEWSAELAVDGEVVQALDFTDLTARQGEAVTMWKTIRCVVIPQNLGTLTTLFVANGVFEGVPLTSLFEGLKLPDTIQRVRFTGADGFTSNMPLDVILNPPEGMPPAILATKLDGAPLTRLRGAPVRLIVPQAWGYKNMKWVTRIELTSSDEAFGQYETGIYGPDRVDQDAHEHIDRSGSMPLMTLITQPASRSTEPIEVRDVTFSGIAMSGTRRIAKIEVSVDGAPYEEIPLPLRGDVLGELEDRVLELDELTIQAGAGSFPYQGIWVPFTHDVNSLTPGEHSVRFRATDDRGLTQPDTIPPADLAAKLGTALPAVEVTFTIA